MSLRARKRLLADRLAALGDTPVPPSCVVGRAARAEPLAVAVEVLARDVAAWVVVVESLREEVRLLADSQRWLNVRLLRLEGESFPGHYQPPRRPEG